MRKREEMRMNRITLGVSLTFTTSLLSPTEKSWSILMALAAASGLAYSQKPKACSLPVAPWTRFQLMMLPHAVSRWRTIAS